MAMSRSSNIRSSFAAMLLAFTSLAAPGATLAGTHGDAVGPGLYALAGDSPTLPVTDLRPLDSIVGNARMVGLGEYVHTSGGFYRMKHRLFRYLVEEKGFRVLGWESPFFRGERAIRYVETCEGTAEDAIRGLFGVFQSTETVDLLRWMCEWNTSHPKEKDRLHLFAFDIQGEAKAHADALVAFLADAGVPDDDPWIDGVRACDGVVTSFYPWEAFPEDRYDACQAALSEIATYFDANEVHLEHQTSPDALGWARVHLVSEQTWQEEIFFWDDDRRSYGVRDIGMAYLAQAIPKLRFPHERVALWAHNAHVSQDGTESLWFEPMGRWLAESLGSSYVAIAQTAHEAEVNWASAGWCGIADFGDTKPIGDALYGVGQSTLLLDLRPRGSHPTFLDPDATYSMGDISEARLTPSFDAIVYLEKSPMMHRLSGPTCQ